MNKLMMMAMVAAMGVAGPVLAAETTIGYSGQLRDAEGKALPESQRNPLITFRLYSDATSDSVLWKVSKRVVLNAEGLFSTELSDSDGANAEKLQDVLGKNATLYIGLSPNDVNNEIKPRQRILETPRAAVATTGADGFTVSGTATISTLKADTVKQKGRDATGKVDYYDLLPAGVIVIWRGMVSEIPAGWVLCDGKSYTGSDGKTVTTPDLGCHVVVGAYTDGRPSTWNLGQAGCSGPKLRCVFSNTEEKYAAGWYSLCYIMKL